VEKVLDLKGNKENIGALMEFLRKNTQILNNAVRPLNQANGTASELAFYKKFFLTFKEKISTNDEMRNFCKNYYISVVKKEKGVTQQALGYMRSVLNPLLQEPINEYS
jgi:hypothetical protein